MKKASSVECRKLTVGKGAEEKADKGEDLDREVAQKAWRPTPRQKANLIVNFVRLQRERENANCVQKMVILAKICFSGRKSDVTGEHLRP